MPLSESATKFGLSLHRHPEMEQMCKVLPDHVIIDLDVYQELVKIHGTRVILPKRDDHESGMMFDSDSMHDALR